MQSFLKSTKVLYLILPLLGGLIFPLGFPSIGLPESPIFSLFGLALFYSTLPFYDLQKWKGFTYYLRNIFIFSLGYCLVGYYWIPRTLEVFGEIPFPISTILGSFLSFLLVPQYIVCIAIMALGRKKIRFLEKLTPLESTVLLAIFVTLLENYTPQQFPAHIGHTWFKFGPSLGLAPIFGVPLLSFVSHLTAISLGHFIYGKVENESRHRRSFYLFPIIILTLTFVANLLLPLDWKSSSTKEINIRFVQANVGNFMKVDSEKGNAQSLSEIYERYERLSTLPSKLKLDLILWPETAYPQLLNTSLMRVTPTFIPNLIRNIVQETQVPLFFGGYDKTGDDNVDRFETEYNASFLITKDNQISDVYHKRVLIPFGESLPLGPLNPLVGKFVENIAFFGHGKSFTSFKLEDKATFISAICYEILFSDYIRDYLNAQDVIPDFLVNLTNDSWYGNTSEPFQHQFLAWWRAIEYQIPVVRITNTGLTSVLYPDGSESQRLGLFKQDFLDTKLLLKDRKPTPFQQWGLLPFITIALITLLLAFTVRLKKD